MSTVLFDTPGPRAKARQRLYSTLAVIALVGIAVLVLVRMSSTGQLDYAKWEPFVTPEFVRALFFDGLVKTLEMAFSSVILAVVFGLVFGLGKMSDHRLLSWPSWLVVEFFRAVPVLMLMIFIFFGGLGPYWSVVIALTLYNGSVLAEVFRAGVDAVPHGQAEAAYAIGLRKSQVMMSVLLPQAVRIMLPAIISQCVVALKDTALGYVILAPGLTEVGKSIFLEFQNQVQTAIVLAAIFILINLGLSWVATRVQRLLVGDSKPLEAPMIGANAGESQYGGGGAV